MSTSINSFGLNTSVCIHTYNNSLALNLLAKSSNVLRISNDFYLGSRFANNCIPQQLLLWDAVVHLCPQQKMLWCAFAVMSYSCGRCGGNARCRPTAVAAARA